MVLWTSLIIHISVYSFIASKLNKIAKQLLVFALYLLPKSKILIEFNYKSLIFKNYFQILDLSSYTIKFIACGLNHSLAVDEWGTLFSWGSDEFGQLGHNLGGGEEECIRKPKLIKSMANLKECL